LTYLCTLDSCFSPQAQTKLELGLNRDSSPKPTLSAGQSTTVLAALAEGYVVLMMGY